MTSSQQEIERLAGVLLDNLKREHFFLKELLRRINDVWCYEDGIYRFYHQSFKVFGVQHATREIVNALTKVSPEGRDFCDFFRQIITSGVSREFSTDDNVNWIQRTTPIVQAFLHARYFLEIGVKYATELIQPPSMLPSGWAALLELYEIR